MGVGRGPLFFIIFLFYLTAELAKFVTRRVGHENTCHSIDWKVLICVRTSMRALCCGVCVCVLCSIVCVCVCVCMCVCVCVCVC